MKTIEDINKKLIDWCTNLEKNPYPEDVFKPIPRKQLAKIHGVLKYEFDMPLDRLTGQIGRLLMEPIIEKAKEMKQYILSPDRETALEAANKFHKEAAEKAIQEQWILTKQKEDLIIENIKLIKENKELTEWISAFQHEENKSWG